MAPFRLLAIDLFAALSIALMALSLVAGPVLAQDPAPCPHPPSSPRPRRPRRLRTSARWHPRTNRRQLPRRSRRQPGRTRRPPPPPRRPWRRALTRPRTPARTPTRRSLAHTRDPDAPPPNLCPAQPAGADPLALLAWAFTPIFQVIFLGLAFFYSLTGDIGIAIILLTITIRILLIPVFRAQIVSQRRMQMLQPELRAIQTKYKGDRARISAEQMQLYKDRGVNPASGCLPSLLQLVLLMPMYQVFSQGLKAPDISSMLSPFGITVVNVTCQSTTDLSAPCIDPDIPWLAWMPTLVGNGPIIPGYPGGLPSNEPEIFVVVILGFGLSLLALASSLLQLVQTRMMTTPSDDPAAAHPAAHVPAAAALLAALRRHPAGRTLHLLDHDHHLQHRPAVPHQRLRRALPALRLDATLRRGPHAALPGEDAGAQAADRRQRRFDPDHPALDHRQRSGHHQAGQATQQPARETSMSEYQEFTGKTVEEAIRSAREAFGVGGLEDLDFEILTQGSRGVLGMGAEPARIIAAPRSALGGSAPKKEAAAAVPPPPPPARPRDEAPREPRPRRDDASRRPGRAQRVTRRWSRPRTTPPRPGGSPASGGRAAVTSPSTEAVAAAVAASSTTPRREPSPDVEASPEALDAGREILERLVALMGYEARIEVSQGPTARITVYGANDDEQEALGALIGRKGERLSALQHLVNLMLSRRMGTWTRVLVDVEDYRGRRERQVVEVATRAAEHVRETGQMLQLEPMSALERRWIHLALRDVEGVATQSIGEEPMRRVVVLPV